MINSVAQLLDNITPAIYQQLKRAVELGKWPTGEKISTEQRELCLQAIIAYEEKNIAAEKRTGYIPQKQHTHCNSHDEDVVSGAGKDELQPLSFKL